MFKQSTNKSSNPKTKNNINNGCLGHLVQQQGWEHEIIKYHGDSFSEMTVLCVDDEASVLASLKRVLRKLDCNVITANSAKTALRIMRGQDVHVIVSDMRMPEMSGAQLFTEVDDLFPDVYRILLTGFSDMSSTIEAINLGQINKYFEKPWQNGRLVDAVTVGLRLAKDKIENLRLNEISIRQNCSLIELNSNLENKVNLRTRQIQSMMQKLTGEHKVMLQLLSNFISINPKIDGRVAKNISYLAGKLAKNLGLPQSQQQTITVAALLGEIGVLGLGESLLKKPIKSLSYEQKKSYYRQVEYADMMLLPASHLQELKQCIIHQYEHFRGEGFPNKISGKEIPIGARILAVARDFWRLMSGKQTGHAMDDLSAKIEIKKFRGAIYDPNVVDALLVEKKLNTNAFRLQNISAKQLSPGMVLQADLFTDSNLLLLSKGHEFTKATIEKLQNIEYAQRKGLMLAIED